MIIIYPITPAKGAASSTKFSIKKIGCVFDYVPLR